MNGSMPRCRLSWFPALLILAGCASKGPVLFREDRYPPIGLQARVVALEIKDARPGRDSLDLPFFGGRRARTFSKPMSASDTLAIADQVKRNLTGNGMPMHLMITVEQAEVGYESSFWKRSESGRFKIRIGIWHGHGKISECTGGGILEKRVRGVSASSLAALFDEGLKMGVYSCLENTKEELFKSPRNAPGGSPI